MNGRKLIWIIFRYFLAVIVIVLLMVTAYVTATFRGFYYDQTADRLESAARLVIRHIDGAVIADDDRKLDRLLKQLGAAGGIRLTFVRPDGSVAADSEHDPTTMENHAGRPEVRAALDGHVGSSTRFSSTLQHEMLYVAVPVDSQGAPAGVLRTAVSTSSLESELRMLHARNVLGALAGLLIALSFAWLLSKRLSRPIEQLKRGVQYLSRESLDYRLQVRDSTEISELAEAINTLSSNLKEQMQIVSNQRSLEAAILESMVEGVIAINSRKRIINLNTSAFRLLRIPQDDVRGRRLEQIIRARDLLRFIERMRTVSESLEEVITLYDAGGERHIRIHGTYLPEPGGRDRGILIVLNDITRLKRLENLRKDFASNVSHELKTPVTAIQGFIETLLQRTDSSPEERQRFLRIVAEQSARLNSIIDDLISLSRIEKEHEIDEIHRERKDLAEVLQTAVSRCRKAAEARGVTLVQQCGPGLYATIGVGLVVQALANLLDNAIKCSDPGSNVDIAAGRVEREIRISVQDHGIGIEARHLPRLFERFYRVDESRSRASGGTGLGLSLVKHIALAHGGRVEVESEPGHGSTFCIYLPVSRD